jgi:hypothetical protein
MYLVILIFFTLVNKIVKMLNFPSQFYIRTNMDINGLLSFFLISFSYLKIFITPSLKKQQVLFMSFEMMRYN